MINELSSNFIKICKNAIDFKNMRFVKLIIFIYKELLDKYFEDEELDVYCCPEVKRWRNVRISKLPSDLSICLLRYSIRNNRSIKTRKQISLNSIINMGKYTVDKSDVLYQLTGVAVHHGVSPRYGHYSYIHYKGGIPIEINDQTIKVYNGSCHLTDSYILHYELIPSDDEICHRSIPYILIGLSESKGWSMLTDYLQSSSVLSLRKKLILEYLQKANVTEDNVSHSWYAYALVQEGINSVYYLPEDDVSLENLTRALLSYLGSNQMYALESNFGVTSVMKSECGKCGKVTVNKQHNMIVDISNLKPIKSIITSDHQDICSLCREESVTEEEYILKFGNSVVIKGNPSMLHPDTYCKIITMFTPKAILSTSDTFLIRHIGNDVEIFQLHSSGEVTDTNMEEVAKVTNSSSHEVLLFADCNDVTSYDKNYQNKP